MTPRQTIDVPPLSIRADVGSVNEDARTVELIFSTGAAVTRYDWMSGKRYNEVLGMKPENVRLQRLNAGAPLLDAHSAWSIGDVLGVVEPDSARIEKGNGVLTVRFPKADDDPDADKIYRKVKDKIIRSVSVGYRVHKFIEEQGKKDEIPTRTAVDWEPYEISLVPMPADAGARVRNGDKTNTNECVLETRASGETVMNENQPSEFVVETPAVPAAAPQQRTTEEVAQPTDRDLGADQERERINGITMACRAARLPNEFAQRLIDGKTPLVKAQSEIFAEMGKRERQDAGPRPGSVPSVELGTDPLVHERAGIENALLHRVAGQLIDKDGNKCFPLTDAGKRYRGMSVLDIARTYLNASGIRTTSMSRNQLAGVALGLTAVRGGYHSTSDFPLLLAEVGNKALRAAYGETPQTFRAIARQANLPDFKPVYRNQLGDAPQLLKVPQNGEFKRGTIGEARETYQLATYGRLFAISRQALVNDDLDAFARVPSDFGREARNIESNLVWEQITSNPTMGDGEALFSAAHANYNAAGDVISVESLGAGRAALRQQRGLGSADQPGHRLNLSARYLIVPTTLETKADQFVTVITPAEAGKANPFSGRLQVIPEPRLEDVANGDLAWYLAASADQIAIVEFGYLEGEEGPMLEQRVGFEVDGLEIKCRLDFAAKVIDYRGIYKDNGDVES